MQSHKQSPEFHGPLTKGRADMKILFCFTQYPALTPYKSQLRTRKPLSTNHSFGSHSALNSLGHRGRPRRAHSPNYGSN